MILIASMLLLAAAQSGDWTPDQSANGNDFGGKMLVVDDPAAFWKAWEGPTPPHIDTTSIITRSRPVQAMLVFYGCRAGRDGNCNVKVIFSIARPDGKPYGESMSGMAWRGPPAPGRNLVASEAAIGFELEVEDALGPYVIKATLTDEISGKSVNLSETVDAKADPPPVPGA